MLRDIIPAKYRRQVYAVVMFAAVIFGLWQASDGNWDTFAGSVITALTTGLATANTNPPPTRNEDGALHPLVTALVCAVLVLAILALVGHPAHVK